MNHGVIQFEASGKWPNDLEALQRVKAAFCLNVARGLRKKYRLRTRVNVDSFDVIKGKLPNSPSIPTIEDNSINK